VCDSFCVFLRTTCFIQGFDGHDHERALLSFAGRAGGPPCAATGVKRVWRLSPQLRTARAAACRVAGGVAVPRLTDTCPPPPPPRARNTDTTHTEFDDDDEFDEDDEAEEVDADVLPSDDSEEPGTGAAAGRRRSRAATGAAAGVCGGGWLCWSCCWCVCMWQGGGLGAAGCVHRHTTAHDRCCTHPSHITRRQPPTKQQVMTTRGMRRWSILMPTRMPRW
jgi:hypothetical protein